MLQIFVHYFLHLVFPLVIAMLFFKKNWVQVYGILLLTMLVDLDHLWAIPIFNPDRCSIGFHLLHSNIAIAFYGFALFFKQTRVIAIGLLLHMLTDSLDCLWNYYS